MKKLSFILLFFIVINSQAQTSEQKLVKSLKQFHQVLVSGNEDSIRLLTTNELTYGHSNGWVETQHEVIDHLQSGFINYNSYKEDSMHIVITGKTAHVRFIADIDATLNSKTSTFHLKVLEVWIKEGKQWKLYARQAVKG